MTDSRLTCSTQSRACQRPSKVGAQPRRPRTPKIKRIATALGTLEFSDGTPTKGTTRKVYDNLDLIHAVDVFVRSFSSVWQYRLREAQRALLRDRAEQPGIFLKVAPKRGGMLRMSRYTAFSFIDLENNGPTVLQLQAGTLGIVKDMWFRFVSELRVAEGNQTFDARYLLLPPNYQGPVPSGYQVIRPRTNQICILVRPAKARADLKTSMLGLTVHRLLCKDSHGAEIEARALPSVEEIGPDDKTFYLDLHRLVQEQPADSLDAERRNLLASIGILKGRPFRPSIRMKAILKEAVAIGSATMRAMKAQHFAPQIATTAKVLPQGVTPIGDGRLLRLSA